MIEQFEVDGVRAVRAPKSGPMRAGLTFRVGRADESLPRTGITHLVEHLALHRHGVADYHFNGLTGVTATHFHMQGNEADVVGFLNGVCAGLADLPLDRMDVEKKIMETEAGTRPGAIDDGAAVWRYGAVGYGLVDYPEWGLYGLGPEQVAAWAATWFTRDNAVLWIAGDRVPPGLRLALPAGSPMPMPTPSRALPVTPAYCTGSRHGVVLDTVVPRGAASVLYSLALERALFRRLRQRDGVSYTATASYHSPGGSWGTVTAVADGLPDRHGEVVEGLVEVVQGLAAGEIEEADVAGARSTYESALSDPDASADRLPAAAVDLLTGAPLRTVAQARAEMAAVSAQDVGRVAAAALGSALLMLPPGHRAEWAGFELAPQFSRSGLTGARFPSREDPRCALVVSDTGVSRSTTFGSSTVRYEACAAVLAWPDGGRNLIGTDGTIVAIEPTLYGVGRRTIAKIDAAVPPGLVVPMPAREPEAIPRPARLARWRVRWRRLRLHGGWRWHRLRLASRERLGPALRALLVLAILGVGVGAIVLAVATGRVLLVALFVMSALGYLWRSRAS